MASNKTDKPIRYRSTFYYQGKRYEATGKTQKEADQKAAVKLDQLKRGEIGISSNMTVKRWAEEWLETYKKPAVGEKQYKDYKSQIDNSILPAIGALRLGDIKDVHLQKILNSKSGKSHTRIKMLHITIRGIFKQAKISKLIAHDISEHLVLPASTNGTHRSITDHEREHFLRAAGSHYAGLMFKVMLYCGLRTGEVVALDWRDIDFEKRRIKVSRAMESGSNRIKEPKTKAGIREVPIPDTLYDELLEAKGGPFEPVFTSKSGNRHTKGSRENAWKSLKNKIDISMGAQFKKDGRKKEKTHSVVATDLVPYCLRHTYCTDLQNNGVPINVAKYLMGHSSIAVTASIYTHISEVAIDTAADLINSNSGKYSGKLNDSIE